MGPFSAVRSLVRPHNRCDPKNAYEKTCVETRKWNQTPQKRPCWEESRERGMGRRKERAGPTAGRWREGDGIEGTKKKKKLCF